METRTQKQIVDPGWGWDRQFGFSQAVRAGGLLFLAGQMPVDPHTAAVVGEGDIRTQAHQVFQNIKAVLEVAGATMGDVVEIVSYHTDMADLGAVAEVKAEYIAEDFPAWTAVGVTALAFPGLMLEIKVTALAR
jgi:reactive intermediate/imine deaminase